MSDDIFIGLWKWFITWRTRHKQAFPEGFSMGFLLLVLGSSSLECAWWGGVLTRHITLFMISFNQFGTWHNFPLYLLALLILGSAGLEALIFGFIAVEAKREIYRRWKQPAH